MARFRRMECIKAVLCFLMKLYSDGLENLRYWRYTRCTVLVLRRHENNHR